MAMNDAFPDVPSLSYPQLFSFQVSYVDFLVTGDSVISARSKKEDYRHGILEVDFDVEMLFVHERDRIFMSQGFSTLRNHVDADYADDCSISIKFDTQQWNITSQNIAEKTCIQHLLECIVNGSTIDESLQIGKEKGIIGLDKNIQKHGQLLRRAISHNKLEERYLILVPGKLLLFKNNDIHGKHVRYATSLLGATLWESAEKQEFQISAPGSKTLSLISQDLKDFESWVTAVANSIESTSQAALVAGMTTMHSKKKRRSRAIKSFKLQHGHRIFDEDTWLYDNGNEMRRNLEDQQLKQPRHAETSMPSKGGNSFQGLSSQLRASKNKSCDAKDARRHSEAMLCLETALNEMKIAVSKIRSLPLAGPSILSKTNLSSSEFPRNLEDHSQMRPYGDRRLWQPCLGHNYVDALISPRLKDPSSQSLPRSLGLTSSVDIDPSLSKVLWRIQTEDSKSSNPLTREEEIMKWRNSNCLIPHAKSGSVSSQPITARQQQMAQTDHGLEITSSDNEEDTDQKQGPRTGTTSAKFSQGARPVTTAESYSTVKKDISCITGRYSASMDAFQPHSEVAGTVEQHVRSFCHTNNSLPGFTTRNGMVKPPDLRPLQASKVPFNSHNDAVNVVEGEPDMLSQNSIYREAKNFDSDVLQSDLLTNSERFSERDCQKMQSGSYDRILAEIRRQPVLDDIYLPQRPSVSHHTTQTGCVYPYEPYPGVKNMPAADSQHEASQNAQQMEFIVGSQQLDRYLNHKGTAGISQDSILFTPKTTRVVPISTPQISMPQNHSNGSKGMTKESGASNAKGGEVITSWHNGIMPIDTAGTSDVPIFYTDLSQISHSQDTTQSAGMVSNSGLIISPGSHHSQSLQYQETTQQIDTSNDHSSQRNSSISSACIFSGNGKEVLARQEVNTKASGLITDTLGIGTMVSDLIGSKSSGIDQACISGLEFLSRRPNHNDLNGNLSYPQAGLNGGQFYSQQSTGPERQHIGCEPASSADKVSTPFNALYFEPAAAAYNSHGSINISNGRDIEGFWNSHLSPYVHPKDKESGPVLCPVISTASDSVMAMRHTEQGAPSAQSGDVAELVNRLTQIPNGEEPVGEKSKLTTIQDVCNAPLNASALPTTNALQDSLNSALNQQSSISRIYGDSTSSYQTSQYTYEPSLGRTSVHNFQDPYGSVTSSSHKNNPALNMQGFSLMSGNGATQVTGPITLKSADGEVIIIGKERRSCTSGFFAPQEFELVHTNSGTRSQEEHPHDMQQQNRRPNLAGDKGALSSDGEAWSLAILKPGTPAQIFKFET